MHRNAVASMQERLRRAVKVTSSKPEQIVCIYSDTSKETQSSTVAQTKGDGVRKLEVQQQHEPLAYLGSKFKVEQKT